MFEMANKPYLALTGMDALSAKYSFTRNGEKILFIDMFSGEDDFYSKVILTKYYNNGQLKLVMINASSTGQFSSFTWKAEYYLNNDSIYFIYSDTENAQWKEVYEQHGKTISVKEERIYFDKYINCIGYLIKEIEGTPEEIANLKNTSPNNEIDCLYANDLINEAKEFIKLK